jgi:predicted transcriptional regulator
MLDWSGDVAKSYESQSGMANLILLSKEGAVAFRITGTSNQEKLQQCFSAIDRLLPEGASPR